MIADMAPLMNVPIGILATPLRFDALKSSSLKPDFWSATNDLVSASLISWDKSSDMGIIPEFPPTRGGLCVGVEVILDLLIDNDGTADSFGMLLGRIESCVEGFANGFVLGTIGLNDGLADGDLGKLANAVELLDGDIVGMVVVGTGLNFARLIKDLQMI